MRLSYNKLWKLLIDKNLNKRKLQQMTGISPNCVAKLGRGENLNTDRANHTKSFWLIT